jgi:hypothetical protein
MTTFQESSVIAAPQAGDDFPFHVEPIFDEGVVGINPETLALIRPVENIGFLRFVSIAHERYLLAVARTASHHCQTDSVTSLALRKLSIASVPPSDP